MLLRNETQRSKLDPFWIRGWVVVRSNGLLVTIRRRGVPRKQRTVNINRVKSADIVHRALMRDDLSEDVSHISHSVEDAPDNEGSQQFRDSSNDSTQPPPPHRYPLRVRRPPERYTDSDF